MNVPIYKHIERKLEKYTDVFMFFGMSWNSKITCLTKEQFFRLFPFFPCLFSAAGFV